jgi:hypothetical protein
VSISPEPLGGEIEGNIFRHETRQGGRDKSFVWLAIVLNMERAGLCTRLSRMVDKDKNVSRLSAVALYNDGAVDDLLGDDRVAVDADQALTITAA